MSATVDRLIHILEQLQNVNYEEPAHARTINANAVAALGLIFIIGKERINFTEQQKKAVAKNLVSAIKPIQINIEGDGFGFQRRLNSIILKKRSALQFLIDTYGSFLVEGEAITLSDLFKRVNFKETIDILDEIIEDNSNISDSYSESDSDSTGSDRDFQGIPRSHTWWS